MNEITRSRREDDLYDQQKVLWELNNGEHLDETYEQVLEVVENAEAEEETI